MNLTAAIVAVSLLSLTGFAQADPGKDCRPYAAMVKAFSAFAPLEIADQYKVDRYLEVLNAAPPVGNLVGDRLLLVRHPQMPAVIVIVSKDGKACSEYTIGLMLHKAAMTAAMRDRQT